MYKFWDYNVVCKIFLNLVTSLRPQQDSSKKVTWVVSDSA